MVTAPGGPATPGRDRRPDRWTGAAIGMTRRPRLRRTPDRTPPDGRGPWARRRCRTGASGEGLPGRGARCRPATAGNGGPGQPPSRATLGRAAAGTGAALGRPADRDGPAGERGGGPASSSPRTAARPGPATTPRRRNPCCRGGSADRRRFAGFGRTCVRNEKSRNVHHRGDPGKAPAKELVISFTSSHSRVSEGPVIGFANPAGRLFRLGGNVVPGWCRAGGGPAKPRVKSPPVEPFGAT